MERIVHQQRMLPTQAAPSSARGGGGGHRTVSHQRTKCLNCGFGLGQYGVEFCGEYCSLDCFTSAKITGRNVPREVRCRRRYEAQTAPWPKGLMVEAPPSPKPWRGRTWSNDSWRTSFTGNLTADESSQDSVTDWHGIGSDFGESGGATAAASDIVSDNVSVGGGGSGGGRASGNGGSGGGNAADVVLVGGKEEDTTEDGGGNPGEGSTHVPVLHEPVGNQDVRAGEDTGRDVTLVTQKAGADASPVDLTGKGNDTVRSCRASPPAMPGPGGPLAAQTRWGCGGRKGEARTVAFSTVPPQMYSPADVGGDGIAGEKSPLEGHQPPPVRGTDEDSPAQGEVTAECVAQGGVTPRGCDGDERSQVSKETAGAVVAGGGGTFNAAPAGRGAQDVIERVDEAKRTAGVLGCEDGVGAQEVAATRGGCGAGCEASTAAGAGAMLVSCAPVRATSTRLAVQQWRHLFLP